MPKWAANWGKHVPGIYSVLNNGVSFKTHPFSRGETKRDRHLSHELQRLGSSPLAYVADEA